MDPTLKRQLLDDLNIEEQYVSTLEKEKVKSVDDLCELISEDCLPDQNLRALDKARLKKFVRTRRSSSAATKVESHNGHKGFTPERKVPNTSSPVSSPTSHRNAPNEDHSANATPSHFVPLNMTANIVTTTSRGEIKSAGVLPVRQFGSSLQLLLGYEHPKRGINFLGGSLEARESPKDGGIREFMEETDLLKIPHLSATLKRTKMLEVHLPHGKYNLYILNIHDLPHCFSKLLSNLPQHFKGSNEVSELFWVDVSDFINGTRFHNVPFYELIIKSTAYVSPELFKFLPTSEPSTRSQNFVNVDSIDEDEDTTPPNENEYLNFEKVMTDEVKRAKELRSKRSLLSFLLPSNWGLKKFMTDIWKLDPGDLSPIVSLDKNDAEYTRLAQTLPPDIVQSLAAIRKVNVDNRKKAFDKQLNDNQNKRPQRHIVFHGTPDPWRATAIALNGFDLSIKLVGRALGDGVYSTDNVATAMSYSKGTGSVIRLDSFINQDKSNLTSLSRPPVYVFPNKDHVLPITLFDFAVDANDPGRKQSEQKKDAEKRFKTMQKEMAKEEKKHEKEVERRFRIMVTAYLNRLSHLNEIHKQHLDKRPLIYKLLAREKNYFDSKLPLYHHKSDIVDCLKKNNVILVHCDTGSGKSTGLCQYIDDYFSELSLTDEKLVNDKRKIAVLQPRRDNAIQLSQKVARDRNVAWGDEVGFSIGLGTCKTSENTRIEFMTHGKFEQIACNANRVLEKFKVVIVDEAHFRSIQIDFVISLLKLVIVAAHQNHVLDFKVIIATATFEQSFFEKLTSFFSPVSTIGHLKFEIPSYPVHIQYYDPFGEDYAQACSKFSFDYFSNAIINAAIEMTAKLLNCTDSGAILVFLPSKSSIDCAISAFASKYVSDPNQSSGMAGNLQNNHLSITIKKGTNSYNVGIYAFHGRLSKAERSGALESRHDRRVYFSTDLAETGLTIPDVRYVIDSGFCQTVRWNSQTNVEEMSRELISQASATQRTGRAGRTNSGICIRLYPESVFKQMNDALVPEVKSGYILKSVLAFLHHQSSSSDFELFEPFDQQDFEHSVDLLEKIAAVKRNGSSLEVTQIGRLVLQLGVSFENALFLINAINNKCVDSAAKICALMVVNGDTLLSNLSSSSPFIHNRGEHSTLLNIFNEFLKQPHDQRSQWCKNQGLDRYVLEDANTAFNHLTDTLTKQKIDFSDQIDEAKGDIHDHIVRTLCCTFFNNLGAFKEPGNVSKKFTLFEENDLASFESIDVDKDNSTTLSLGSTSRKLWTGRDLPEDYNFIVFSSLMSNVTQNPETGEKTFRKSLSFVSFCTTQDLKDSSPSWRVKTLENQLNRYKRTKFEVPISREQRRLLLNNKGERLRDLRQQIKTAEINLPQKNDSLIVFCPESIESHIKRRVGEFLESHKPEIIRFENLDGINFGKFLGKNRSNANDLQQKLTDVLKSVSPNPHNVKLIVDSTKKKRRSYCTSCSVPVCFSNTWSRTN
ncbi:hypothetical protein P9112_012668 [Eukaryota sp. TZLM1-RC]